MANYKATQRRPANNLVGGKGEANGIKTLIATIEAAALASGSTIEFGRIPSNARILGRSTVYFDDLATSGSPTLDLGLAAVNSNITTDDDCFNDGINVYTAASNASVIKDVANVGKQAWEFVNGQTSDPKGELIVQGVIRDAALTATATISLELLYVID